jgi:hypothetical protein
VARPYSHRVAVLRGTREIHIIIFDFIYRAFTVYGSLFQSFLLSKIIIDVAPKPHSLATMVWASPLSLAATNGIPREVSFPPDT